MASYSFGNGLGIDPSAEWQKGAQQRKETQLGRLLGQAYSAPTEQRSGLLGRIAQISPDRAMTAEKAFGDRDATRMKSLGDKARIVASAARGGNKQLAASLYPSLVQEATGVFGPNSLSPEWDDSQLEALTAFANAVSPQAQQEQFTLAPGSSRYGADGRLLVAQPFAPPDKKLVDVPDGRGGTIQMEYNGSGFSLPNYGQTPPSAAPAPAPGKTLSPPQDFQQLVSSFGAKPTSLYRDPEHNRQVGGVANSQHTAGTAGDFAIPPQSRPAFISQARQMGYEAIDEGDHVHVELPPGAQASGRFGPGQGGGGGGLGYTPPKRSGAAFAPLNSDEIAQLGLPAGTVAQRNLETGQVSVINKPDARAGTGATPLSAGEAAKVRRDFKETKDALNTFKAFDTALGDISKSDSVLDGASRGRLGNAYNNARAALRIIYNTGVLQPGELPMLNQALADPNGAMALADPRSRAQIQGQLDELYRVIARSIDNQVGSYPQIFDPQKYEAAKAAGKPAATGKSVTRTGTLNGRKVVQYSDGTTDYAD